MEILPTDRRRRPASTCWPTGCAPARVVPLLADRDLSARGVEVDFFGGRTRMPAGPALLALRTGAPLYSASTVVRAGRALRGSWRVRCRCRSRQRAAGRAGPAADPADRGRLWRRASPGTRRTGTCCSGCGWTSRAPPPAAGPPRRRPRPPPIGLRRGASVRIGIVCPYSFDVPGGVQNHVRDLAETLIALGHDVSVLAPADEERRCRRTCRPAGRAVPVPYNGSVARLAFGPIFGGPGAAVAGRRATSTSCTCTSRSRRACRCWRCCRPGGRWWRRSTPR